MADFADRVAAYIDDDELEIRVDRLATTFEVSTSTVRSWANERGKPHPRLQKQVIEWINKETAS